jgi:hypothetical protein
VWQDVRNDNDGYFYAFSSQYIDYALALCLLPTWALQSPIQSNLATPKYATSKKKKAIRRVGEELICVIQMDDLAPVRARFPMASVLMYLSTLRYAACLCSVDVTTLSKTFAGGR